MEALARDHESRSKSFSSRIYKLLHIFMYQRILILLIVQEQKSFLTLKQKSLLIHIKQKNI